MDKISIKLNKTQIGGTFNRNEDSLETIITKPNNTKIIGPKNTEYPSEYIGYNIFLPISLDKQITLDQIIYESLFEGEFLYKDKNINVYKLNDQFLNDSFRMVIVVNKQNMFNNFNIQIKNTTFNTKLNEIKNISQLEEFKIKLIEVFPHLNLQEEEIKCIDEFSKKNTWDILPNYWAFLPFFDETINEYGVIDENKLNSIKVLSQQNILKPMINILNKFISLPDIFDNTLHITRTFNVFGENMNNYIKQINTRPIVIIDISTSQEMIVQNKIYFSLVNIENEFGLATISTCIYNNFQKNETFIMWKIERWRNPIIKQYYNFFIDLSKKGIAISSELLISMQLYIYNNKISDKYPKTHQELFMYFKNVFTNENDMDKKELINNINEKIKEELDKETSDDSISKLINKIGSNNKKQHIVSQINETENSENTEEEEKEEEEEEEEKEENEEDETKNEGTLYEMSNGEELNSTINKNATADNTPIEKNNINETLLEDEKEITEAKEHLNNTIENYHKDEEQLRDEQPPLSENDRLINTLSTLGSITALGAIGTGLYMASPLLMLGGGEKKKRKTRNKKKRETRKKRKTRKNKIVT